MILIDTVYQRVLALANKEQRGYITPQEFNLFANMAQQEIFEQYFYDLNQATRIPGNDTVHADVDDMLEEKLQIFEDTIFVPSPGVIPTTVYRVSTVEYGGIDCDILKTKDFRDVIGGGPLTAPTVIRPVATIRNNILRVAVDQTAVINSGTILYFRKPIQVQWTYVVVNKKALYDPTYASHFELHSSEESELVYKILKFGGVSMKREDVAIAAQNAEISQIQQQKQ
jgi:hypothetical protein